MIDAAALGLIRRGDESALGQIIGKYSAYVCAVIRNAAGSGLTHEDVEETASDVLLALWDSAGSVQRIKPWLGATARNKAKNKLREIRDALPLDDEITALGGTLEDAVISAGDSAAVKTAILAMGPLDREIFLRHYYERQTTATIGAETGMSKSAVEQRLVRGREKLRKVLEQEVLP
ncbi:MAG: sigma-70 family RNA polymerase sigma factor [Oscillospiraceae bacterium]|nr:sigma-70 family RNA polymerase sigma factor [Oscillospiraceae bacterium]